MCVACACVCVCVMCVCVYTFSFLKAHTPHSSEHSRDRVSVIGCRAVTRVPDADPVAHVAPGPCVA